MGVGLGVTVAVVDPVNVAVLVAVGDQVAERLAVTVAVLEGVRVALLVGDRLGVGD
ncbi:MAG: hypothetical protein HYR72_05330 [Deltaproteobacteria bacterium]|nr:hypothetical protein [Deltaproteobacteria bacterium]MBI3389689.1 hypothetical protein [Deltaproteobacteria bacterium]